jgi:tRNA pseudouridine-54 N-methylase
VGQDIRATEIKHDPIFILGHFRSGTSLLHELMSKVRGRETQEESN